MKKSISCLILGLIFLSISTFSCYSPKYSYRVLAWQEADYNDGDKFKFSEIKKATEVFNFKKSSQEEKNLSRLAQYVENDDFIAFLKERGTHSFLVIRNDSIIIEKYFKNDNRETLQNTFSISKSIMALAVMKSIELETIKNLDEPITLYIPELYDRNEDFKKITIGDLLRMKSGIKFSPKTKFPWLNQDSPLTYYHPNLRWSAIKNSKIENEPNKEFVYNNYNPLLLGLILEKANKMKLSEFIEKHIWSKIGTEFDARWSTDENEFEKMESGFMASPIDLAKIGRLVLNKGEYNGTTILTERLLEEFTKTESELEVYEGRIWGYGHFWWTLPDGTPNPSIMANGNMGQFIFVNPKTNYIIVRNGLKVGKFYDDDWTEIFKSYTSVN